MKLNKLFDVINLAVERTLTLHEIISIIKDILGSKSEISVSHKKHTFSSLSIEKAKNEYLFEPFDIKSTIALWCEERIANLKL